MKEAQKFIIVGLALGVIGWAIPLIINIYIASTYDVSQLPPAIWKNKQLILSVLFIIQNFASALWLYHLASKDGVNRILWSMFGLFSGLISVAIFYLVRINERLKT